MPWFSRWVVLTVCVALQWCASPLTAQWQSNTGPAGAALGAVVGGDVERYVRALAMAGVIKPVAWGARAFGPVELSELLSDTSSGAHPWQPAMQKALVPRASLGGMLFSSVNTGFPWGANDGAMWQGRGLTTALGGAATFRWGPVTAVAAPVVFWAQNASFPLIPQHIDGVSPYGEPQYAFVVDLPQRMGASAYHRFDAGESSIRLSLRTVNVGISTASLGWGTGEAFPAIFGSNAGGFPHLFFGTNGRGLAVPGFGRISGQYILGLLQQSAWSPVQGSETYVDVNQPGTQRLATGLSISFMPQFVSGLELGASRFFHSPYRAGSSRWNGWSKPFEGLFKKGLRTSPGTGDPTGDADNQMASLFARWIFPRRGVEANLEIFREDHNWDSRDLAEEPENNSAVLASLRATTHRSASSIGILSFEYFDGDVRPIAQAREQEALYVHTGLRQGHTQRGQLLGAPMGVGAITSQRIAWERFDSASSLRMSIQRWQPRSRRHSDIQGLYSGALAPVPESHDWTIDAGAAWTRYHGARALTVEGGLAWAGRWQLGDSRANPYIRASAGFF